MDLKRFNDDFFDLGRFLILLGVLSGLTQDAFGRHPITQIVQVLSIIGVLFGGFTNKNDTWIDYVFSISFLVLAFVPGATGNFSPNGAAFLIALIGSIVLLAIRSTGRMDKFTHPKHFPMLLAAAIVYTMF